MHVDSRREEARNVDRHQCSPRRLQDQSVQPSRSALVDQSEVELKVEAATTCGTDVKVFKRGGHPRMLKVPTLFGHEMAGTVAQVGPEVTQFNLGDRVVVANSAPCGSCEYCSIQRENLCEDLHYLNGAFAEYLKVPARFQEKNTHLLPDELSFDALDVRLGGCAWCDGSGGGRRGIGGFGCG